MEEAPSAMATAVPAAPVPEPVVAQPVAVEQAAPGPEVVAIPLPREPQVIASFAPPPATYNVVSEHDKAEDEAHRPVRRRRHEAAPPPAEPLELVETAAEKAAALAQPVFEAEAPRQPVRRRRQALAASASAEPLQLVETKAGAEPAEGASPQP